jgi:hypothetical protein
MKTRQAFVSSLTLAVAMLVPSPVSGGPSCGGVDDGYERYFGDLHSHTRYSDNWEGTPRDAYVHARRSGGDYLATTDHNFMLTEQEWRRTLRQAEEETGPRFAALPASEYWVASGFGELLVYNRRELRNDANFQEPGENTDRHERIGAFYDWVASHRGAVGIWPHPGIYGDLDRLRHHTPERDVMIAGIEIHNYGSWLGGRANWGVHDYEEWYVLGLDRGWHLMPVAVSDTHSPDWISGSPVRTVLLATDLTPRDLYGAMREHRGYATLDKNLRVSFTVDGAVMGSELTAGSTVQARVHVSDPNCTRRDRITRIVIVSDGGDVVARTDANAPEVEWTVALDASTATYFYARITTASDVSGGEGVTAWTAPVWTGR